MPNHITTLAFSCLIAFTAASSASAQDAKSGAAIYGRCAICHSNSGKISVGPPLNGVIGRKAASVPKFAYSRAMMAQTITWDKVSLDKFLRAPQAMVRGTKMAFVGLNKAKDRQDVIAYLATLKK
ncbi:c-type cytochrome [Sphingobium sp. CECT 9361]|uniref:c-type cytochrome n=1 Tax=Sphingobium sp. CECT 9361 TaxID=2845384 RepID=UPI001E393418|nr:c-type cytochrome [Sphingobium sp. CECT 9361]CAH0352728.1 Cytochrome c2 [Sphingobium sp. CECT 9361]